MSKAVYVTTFSGAKINIEAFDAATQFNLVDAAISLSRQRRYAGHTALPWSVGQHSVLCSMISQVLNLPEEVTQLTFLHDVEEYLIQDIIWPIKRNYTLSAYDSVSDYVSAEIFKFFGLTESYEKYHKIVHSIDQAAYHIEATGLIPSYRYTTSLFDDDTNAVIADLTKVNFAIPKELLVMPESDIAQNMLEIMQVLDAENKFKQRISTEADVREPA